MSYEFKRVVLEDGERKVTLEGDFTRTAVEAVIAAFFTFPPLRVIDDDDLPSMDKPKREAVS